MPYLDCPSCELSLYSAARHSSTGHGCPVCGASLAGATKRFPGAAGARTLCREFLSTPEAVANARHTLDGLHEELGYAVGNKAALLIGELVRHSVKHSKLPGGMIEVLVCVTRRVVHVEVSDDGEGFGAPADADRIAEWGRGIQLVRELADRWARPSGLQTSVWFELDRAPARATATRPDAADGRNTRGMGLRVAT